MDRNFYYIGIAGFGMINGLFNQALVPFSYLFVKVLAPALLFDIDSLALMMASLMASTATIIAGGWARCGSTKRIGTASAQACAALGMRSKERIMASSSISGRI